MQQLKLLSAILLSSFLLYSCSGNTNANAGKDESPTASAAATSDASFSCKIDGKDFSGKGSSSYANTAIVSSPGLINFVLVPMDAAQKGVPPQFNFFVADKGTTTIPDANNSAHSVTYSSGLDNYICKEMTITITSSGTSRVTGTFSGTFVKENSTINTQVTDGKFDIPYSR